MISCKLGKLRIGSYAYLTANKAVFGVDELRLSCVGAVTSHRNTALEGVVASCCGSYTGHAQLFVSKLRHFGGKKC